MTENEQKITYRPREVAKLLDIGVNRVYAMIESGDIQVIERYGVKVKPYVIPKYAFDQKFMPAEPVVDNDEIKRLRKENERLRSVINGLVGDLGRLIGTLSKSIDNA